MSAKLLQSGVLTYFAIFIIFHHFGSNLKLYQLKQSSRQDLWTSFTSHRVHLKEKICHKYSKWLKVRPLSTSHFIYNEEFDMLGCVINKVGSTSLTQSFLSLIGLNYTNSQELWANSYKGMILKCTTEATKNFEEIFPGFLPRISSLDFFPGFLLWISSLDFFSGFLFWIILNSSK